MSIGDGSSLNGGVKRGGEEVFERGQEGGVVEMGS